MLSKQDVITLLYYGTEYLYSTHNHVMQEKALCRMESIKANVDRPSTLRQIDVFIKSVTEKPSMPRALQAIRTLLEYEVTWDADSVM